MKNRSPGEVRVFWRTWPWELEVSVGTEEDDYWVAVAGMITYRVGKDKWSGLKIKLASKWLGGTKEIY